MGGPTLLDVRRFGYGKLYPYLYREFADFVVFG